MRWWSRGWPIVAVFAVLALIIVFAVVAYPGPDVSDSAEPREHGTNDERPVPEPTPPTSTGGRPGSTAGFDNRHDAQLAEAREIMSGHLDAPVVDAWLSLARPGIRLIPADADHAPTGSPAVGRIGGVPDLPADTGWPVGSDGLPLDFLLQIDLAVLAGSGLEHGLNLPDHGLLLAFAATGESGGRILDWTHPDIREDTRLIHVTGDAAPRPTPEGIGETRGEDLTGVGIMTLPTRWHEEFQAVTEQLAPDEERLDRVSVGLGSVQGPLPLHQLGGWADPQQDAPEVDYLRTWAPDEPRENWGLLLQIDYDDERDWMFGDLGTAYWVTDTTKDNAVEHTGFVVQHG